MKTYLTNEITIKEQEEIEQLISTFADINSKDLDHQHECYKEILNIRDLLNDLEQFTILDRSFMSFFSRMLKTAIIHDPDCSEAYFDVFDNFTALAHSAFTHNKLIESKCEKYEKLAETFEKLKY